MNSVNSSESVCRLKPDGIGVESPIHCDVDNANFEWPVSEPTNEGFSNRDGVGLVLQSVLLISDRCLIRLGGR